MILAAKYYSMKVFIAPELYPCLLGPNQRILSITVFYVIVKCNVELYCQIWWEGGIRVFSLTRHT